jgi:hypothetical protein
MVEAANRRGHTESVISICLLGVLLLIGLGVVIKQSYYYGSKSGMETANVALPGQKSGAGEKAKEILLALKLVGFEGSAKVAAYNNANLYEKIDGKADEYIEAGFQALFTRLFTNKNDNTPGMEFYLFDMGNARNAFSIYSMQKRPGVESTDGLEFGYKTSNSLYFACGKYYAEFIGFSESGELVKTMTQIAKDIQTSLQVDNTAIPEFALFPQQGLVPNSFKLYTKNTFGFEGLTDTFTAQYDIDGQTVTAFLSRRSTPAEASDVLSKYHKFLLENGGRDIPIDSSQIKYVDIEGSTEIIFSQGPFVGGIHEVEKNQLNEKLEKMVLGKLIDAAKANGND